MAFEPNWTNGQMETFLTTVESQAIVLATRALTTFCEDIAGMFGVGVQCEQQQVCAETVAGLKKRFRKLVAVNVMDSQGLLEGTFQFVLDREGLFTLGGVIAMQPEQRILTNRKGASPQLAASMVDAVGQAGNLLVSSWDKVFQAGLEGHGHFVQRLPAFVGTPWDQPLEKIGLPGGQELIYIPYEMTVGSYPAFNCGVIFPKTIFGGDSDVKEAVQKDQTEAGTEPDVRPEQANQARTETGEKPGPEQLDAPVVPGTPYAEQPAPRTPGGQDVVPEAQVVEHVSQEQTPSPQNSDGPAEATISETIRKMAQSPAILPGESSRPTIVDSTAFRASGGLWSICAEDIMQTQVIWAGPDETVQQALAKMQQGNTGYIMVGHEGALEGIISKSDIAGALSPYLRSVFAKWRRPLDDATLTIRIKWVMSRPVRTIQPRTPLATIMENICRFGGRALPVVDEQGKVRGLVTVFEIFQTLLKTCADISTAGKTFQTPPPA
jgi:CBS domain-containing protein